MKKLTVAIPTFNGGQNLERAIKSCERIQILPDNYEILVIDNCSTDDSISNVNKLKKKFRNLRLVENENNVGRIQNWNVSIDNAQGKFLIFLFSNDEINEENNIHECIKTLDNDETISIVFASLLKKEIEQSFLKKSFATDMIKCKSKCFTKECLNRGLLPFGPIQSIIYRVQDINKDRNRFHEKMPINADEIFTYKEVIKREKILFTPKPQITWDLTQGRFHGKMKIEDEFKEHPSQKLRSWRKISIYKELLGLQNVKVIHPSVKPDELLKHCKMVVSISGTSALEASFFNKPSIIFSDVVFSELSWIQRLDSFEKLNEKIKTSLEMSVNQDELNNYVDYIIKNSFDYDNDNFSVMSQEFFHHGGFLVDTNIEENQMKQFIEKHDEIFSKIADEFLKKIQPKS